MRAATRVFANNGYYNSKVADIAREAGIADGTVYLYFKSKEDILHSIFERAVEEIVSEARKQLETVADPREKLRRIAWLHLERLGADHELTVILQVEMRASTKFMEAFSAAGLAEYLRLISEVFEEGQRAGVFRRDLSAKLVAKVIFGALDEMATNWMLSKRRYKLAPVANEVLEIFLDGITTDDIVLPDARRAFVSLLEEEPITKISETALLSEQVLAEDWNRPEEDEAWSYLQQAQ